MLIFHVEIQRYPDKSSYCTFGRIWYLSFPSVSSMQAHQSNFLKQPSLFSGPLIIVAERAWTYHHIFKIGVIYFSDINTKKFVPRDYARVDADNKQFVGRDSEDWIIYGIAGLLQWCLQVKKSLKKPLDIRYG